MKRLLLVVAAFVVIVGFDRPTVNANDGDCTFPTNISCSYNPGGDECDNDDTCSVCGSGTFGPCQRF